MTKEELIKKHLEGWYGLQQASIQHFSETGRASGSFFIALKAMMDEYAENVAKNISSNLSVSGSHCSHPPTYRRRNNDGTPYCAKCNLDIREQ